MAWVADADFNGLSDGDLNGQAGGSGWSTNWSGTTTFDVQGTTVYEGAKAVTYNGAGAYISRTLTTDLTGNGNILYVAMRAAQTNGGGFQFILRNTGDSGSAYIQFDAVDGRGTTGNIYLLCRVAGVVSVVPVVLGYSANTWYVFRLTVNATAGTFSAAYSTGAYGSGGTFSSDTATVDFVNTGNSRYVALSAENTSADYLVDYISPTTPFAAAGPAGVKTFDGVTQSTGIKTYMGVTTATTKSVMGVT